MALRSTVNISLTPVLGQFIKARVASGRYQSASEVVREGLRVLEREELRRAAALADLRGKIGVGLRRAKRSQLLDGEAVFEELTRSTRRRRRG